MYGSNLWVCYRAQQDGQIEGCFVSVGQSRVFKFPGPLLGWGVVVDAHLVICCRAMRDDHFGVWHDPVRPFFHIDLHSTGCTWALRPWHHTEPKIGNRKKWDAYIEMFALSTRSRWCKRRVSTTYRCPLIEWKLLNSLIASSPKLNVEPHVPWTWK